MGTMTSIRLTCSHEIVRRTLVAACAIFALGVAGTVAGRAASQEEAVTKHVHLAAEPVAPLAAPAVVMDEPTVELAAAKIAPEIVENVITPELLVPITPAAPAIPIIKTIEMEVTAYCPCKKCCGPKAQGITASGKRVDYNGGQFVAADKRFAFGTKLFIPGYAGGKAVEVTDRGGAIKGNKLDVYFHSHAEALKWGRQKLTVTVVE